MLTIHHQASMPHSFQQFWGKLTRYEYWPWWVFYAPLLPYYLYQSLRARSLVFGTSANPFIELSGLVGESKQAILAQIPAAYKPETLFIAAGTGLAQTESLIANAAICYPLVAKPDVGERGNGVEKITDAKALANYLTIHTDDFIVQAYVDYPIELGVLYYRLPGAAHGRVTSLTLKEFLAVRGDGRHTIRQLVGQSLRGQLQIGALQARLGPMLDRVLPENEKCELEPIGNHCRGTKFINANDRITPELHLVFDQIAAAIPGFHYGRFDLRVPSWAHLYDGHQVRIMELNGISSEPGHIYDPSYQLWRAYRDVAQHLRLLADISLAQRQRGIRPASLRQVWAALRAWG